MSISNLKPSKPLTARDRRRLQPATNAAAAPAASTTSRSRAHKVSVSMPEDLTAAVQQRVERGEFSQYVTRAVERQLELDLLAELSELMDSEQGQVPEAELTKARLAWPDAA